MSVRFELGWAGADFYIQNPNLSDRVDRTRMQVIRQTASGKYYIYDKSVKAEIWTLEWTELRESEKTDLEGFFISTARGGLYAFVFTDWRGNKWNVGFLQPTIRFRQVADVRAGAATTFSSGGTDYPTTTREKGVWATEIKLRIIGAA